MSSHLSPQTDLLDRAYPAYTSGKYLQSVVLLLFRLSYGWEMYLSGYRHLHDVDTMVHRFEEWGVPFPTFNVYVSGSTELFCGALLMLGLATRLVSIPLVFNFIVAILTAGRSKIQQALTGGDHLDELGGLEAIVNDTAFPFLLTSLLTFTLGAGKVSVDYLILRSWYQPRLRKRSAVSAGSVQDRRPTDA